MDNDGEFFMSFEDFLINFDQMEICNITPDPLDEIDGNLQWHESRFYGSWIPGQRNHLLT